MVRKTPDIYKDEVAVTTLDAGTRPPHIAADRGMAIDVGRDIELAFARLHADLTDADFDMKLVEPDEVLETSVAEARYIHVAQVRLAPAAAMNLAMNIIAMMSEAGRVDLGQLQRFVDGLQAQLRHATSEA